MKKAKMKPRTAANQTTTTLNDLAVIEDTPLDEIRLIIDAALDAKGSDISVLDVRGVFDLSDFFVIVSARSDRQAQGICNRVLDSLGAHGIQPQLIEGYDDGHWILIDFGDLVLHVFYGPTRNKYDLEGLWVKAQKLTLEFDEQTGRDVLRAA